MKTINKAILIGRLGKDPEVRYTQGGQAVARFSLATDESWSDRSTGERQSRTEWHNIVVWAKLAEICGQYLKKGSLVYLEGRIQSRQYEDQSGAKRYITEIVVNDMCMLDGKGGGGAPMPDSSYHQEPPMEQGGNALREGQPARDGGGFRDSAPPRNGAPYRSPDRPIGPSDEDVPF